MTGFETIESLLGLREYNKWCSFGVQVRAIHIFSVVI